MYEVGDRIVICTAKGNTKHFARVSKILKDSDSVYVNYDEEPEVGYLAYTQWITLLYSLRDNPFDLDLI